MPKQATRRLFEAISKESLQRYSALDPNPPEIRSSVGSTPTGFSQGGGSFRRTVQDFGHPGQWRTGPGDEAAGRARFTVEVLAAAAILSGVGFTCMDAGKGREPLALRARSDLPACSRRLTEPRL